MAPPGSAAAASTDAHPVLARVHAQVVEPFGVALQQLVLLAGEDAGDRERRAGFRCGSEGERELTQRAGKNVGDEYVRRVESLLARGLVPAEFGPKHDVSTTLRESVRHYLQAQHVAPDDAKLLRIVLQRLPAHFQLPGVTFVWATAWVTSMKREQNLAPSTLRKHVGALSRCFNWLAASGDIPFNPLASLAKGYATYTPEDVAKLKRIDGVAKGDTERDRRLEAEDELAIRKVLAGHKPAGRQRALAQDHGDSLQLLFNMALESAMRMREMFTLSVNQVDMKKQTIFLDKTKNGSKRQVPITTVLQSLLVPAMKGKAASEQLFPWWDGDMSKKSLDKTTSLLSRQFARIFEAAGCADLHFHDLRHEATSRLFERTGLSDLEIAKITGHKSLVMLMRYANLRGSNLAGRLW